MTQKTPFIFLSIALSLIAVSFNNCSDQYLSKVESSKLQNTDAQNTLVDLCKETEESLFEKGYHNFLSTTCKNCHVVGPGKGNFADPNPASAFTGFKMLGYDKISRYALSDSHNPPFTGTHNVEVVNQLRLQWQTYLTQQSSCGNSANASTSESIDYQFITSEKALPSIASKVETVTINGTQTSLTTFERKQIKWSLNSELFPLSKATVPNLTNVEFTITVTGFQTSTGERALLVTAPTVKVADQSVSIKGLKIKLNGFVNKYSSTYNNLSENIYQNTSTMISAGSSVFVGNFSEKDQLSIEFGSIELIQMAAPPPPATVQFVSTEFTIQKINQGFANQVVFDVEVVGTSFSPIHLSVRSVDSNRYASNELEARSILGNDGRNRFDWDYQFDPSRNGNIQIGATQKKASFAIIFSDDERFEPTRVLKLEITSALGAQIGNKNIMTITIPSFASQSTSGIPTFSQLMSKSGILNNNCVKCHNSALKMGGYDMTNYQDMVNRRIIIPGDPNGNNHKMFRRMNADAPNIEGLQPMPLDQFLTRDLVQFVEQWILNGAKNN
jgi:hypothetical protein